MHRSPTRAPSRVGKARIFAAPSSVQIVSRLSHPFGAGNLACYYCICYICVEA
jgi:hypothetical protein